MTESGSPGRHIVVADGAGEAGVGRRPGTTSRTAVAVHALGGAASATPTRRRTAPCHRDQAGAEPDEPRTPGRTSDLRYQVNAEDPGRSRWPELKARIGTAGYDPGAA